MKKLFFIAAIAGAALVSCTKNEVAPSADREITFAAPVVGSQTKAQYGEIGTFYNQNETFGVHAVHTDGDLVTWEAGSQYMGTKDNIGLQCLKNSAENFWAPDIPYYWPKEGKLSFAAYSPFDVSGTVQYGATGLIVTGHTVSNDISKHVDFLYAPRVYNYTASRVAGGDESGDDDTIYKYEGVNIMFKHAMSSIIFKVARNSAIDGNTVITLKKLTLLQPNSVGTFTETITDGATYNATPTWSAQGTPIDLVTYENTAELTTTLTEYVNGANDIILIPQTLSNDVKLVLNYTIKNPGGHVINQESTIQLNGYTPAWGIGTRYTYNITIGLDEIIFDPAVTAWDDVNAPSITL